jgi:exosortase
VLFARPLTTLVRDWWTLPEAGHGILLTPIALWLAWRGGRHPGAARSVWLGAAILLTAVALRAASSLAAELFTMRLSMVAALLGLTVFHGGIRQARHWRLSFLLLVLAIPLPALVTQELTLPLQFQASELGASLLELRGVPVLLTGNVIRIPGHELFVTEACSGLRSLAALISIAVLAGAFFLRSGAARIALLVVAVPIAIIVNGVRVFLTGFLVHFASPAMGTGFMHATEGWLLFLVSLSALAGAAALTGIAERAVARRGHRA